MACLAKSTGKPVLWMQTHLSHAAARDRRSSQKGWRVAASSLGCGGRLLSLSRPPPSPPATSARLRSPRRPFTRCCTAAVGDSGAVRSPDVVEEEYADLSLKPVYANMGHLRIRQHVNPLSSSFTVPVHPPDWKEVFREPRLPLMVDIGCGSGRFLIWLAKNSSGCRNFLGLEIRQKLVQRSQIWVKELGLRNIHFMYANATVSFELLVSSYRGPLSFVSILCPDPHFKKRHHKRRVLQAPLVDSISKNLCLGGRVLLQSDVLEVADDMREKFDGYSHVFEHVDCIEQDLRCDREGWLLDNPMGIRTEREIHAELEGAKIYRRMYQKTKEVCR